MHDELMIVPVDVPHLDDDLAPAGEDITHQTAHVMEPCKQCTDLSDLTIKKGNSGGILDDIFNVLVLPFVVDE